MPSLYPTGIDQDLSTEELPAIWANLYSAGMQVIAANSKFDAAAGGLMAALLGIGNREGAIVYGKLRSPRHQAEAIKDIASLRMEPEDQKRLAKVLSYAGEESFFRDILAHGLWLAESKLPEAAVIVDASMISDLIGGKTTEDLTLSASIWTRGSFERHLALSNDLFLSFSNMIPLAFPKDAAHVIGDWRERVDEMINRQARTIEKLRAFRTAQQAQRKR